MTYIDLTHECYQVTDDKDSVSHCERDWVWADCSVVDIWIQQG